jgi:hypothetical protein
MIRRTLLILLIALAAAFSGGAARGASYNFADFIDLSGTRPFDFTNNVTSGTILATSVPITFNFTAPTGLPTTNRPATLNISTRGGVSASDPATGGATDDQPINNPTLLTITENSTGKTLLSMSFTGDILGKDAGPNAQLAGADSNGQMVTFSSDDLNFTTGNSYALSLASMTPALSIGPGGFLSSFVADITGQFSGNATAVPEPISIGLLALLPLALLRRR